MSGQSAQPGPPGRDPADRPDLSAPVEPVEPSVMGEETPVEPVAKPVAFTRAGAAWVATGTALLLLILLIVFILQNSGRVQVSYLGWSGSLPLGVAMLIAAVTGGVLVAIAGVARITQLRRVARRQARVGTGT